MQEKVANQLCLFQSTLPQGERHLIDQQGKLPWNFNPRSRKGSDKSIHLRGYAVKNFNPRSHKGSDMVYALRLVEKEDFNPRSHKGSDYGNIKTTSYNIISIHAPTRGATCTRKNK